MDLRRLLETVRTNDLYDLIAQALNVLDQREEPETPEDRIHAEVYAQHASIERSDGAFGVTYYSEANAVEAAIERGTNPDEALIQQYENQAGL